MRCKWKISEINLRFYKKEEHTNVHSADMLFFIYYVLVNSPKLLPYFFFAAFSASITF